MHTESVTLGLRFQRLWTRLIGGAAELSAGHYRLYRQGLGLYLLIHFLHLLPYAAEVFAAGGSVAQAALSPFFGLLPNPLWWNDSDWAVRGLLLVGVGCGVALVVGRGDRMAAVVAALILSFLFQRNPLIANPSLPLLGWLLLLHACVPPLPRGRVAQMGESWTLPRHWQVAAWIMLALAYSYSGWTKLASPGWVEGEAIRQVLNNPLAREHALREWLLATPPWLLQGLTWTVLWVELLFAPLALIARLRPWLWGLMLGAQFGFLTFLNFADLTAPMLLAHALCFDPAWLRRWQSRRPALLLFDGECAFCNACVRLAWQEDRAGLLQFAPLGGRTARERGVLGPAGTQASSIVLLDEAGARRKSAAVIGVLQRLGGVWLLFAALLWLLPKALADAGYDAVGRWRYRWAARAATVCPLGNDGRLLP